MPERKKTANQLDTYFQDTEIYLSKYFLAILPTVYTVYTVHPKVPSHRRWLVIPL